jgi:hypothetical protein
MTDQFLEYPLQNGFINNWLVAGPYQQHISFDQGFPEEERTRQLEITRKVHDPNPGFQGTPSDRSSFEYNGQTLTWRYFKCQLDHLVDVSSVLPTWQLLRTWAFARLTLKRSAGVEFCLATPGPAQVWLNGKPVYQQDEYPAPLKLERFSADLERENELLVRFDHVGVGECAHVMALQIVKFPAGMKEDELLVQVPTSARFPNRHQAFEQMFEKAYLEEAANYRGMHVNLHWAEDTKEEMRYAYQLQDAEERIYVEGTWDPDSKEGLDIGHPQRIFERPMWVVLRAPGKEYFEQNLRYQRKMPIYIHDNEYSPQPYGSFAGRKYEALEYAARREGDLFAEIAKMALEQWDKLDPTAVNRSIDSINGKEAGSPGLLVGLLGIVYRFGEKPGFPGSLKQAVKDSVLRYCYGKDEPGGEAIDFNSESQAILGITARLLAGQLYPDEVFPISGQTGKQHRELAEKLALDWMRQRGQGGFMEWNSNSTFELDILALTHLTSLAENEPVCDLAAVLLDKMLFLLAVHSYQGAFGSTHGRTGAAMIKSAKLEATSGIERLLWGTGIYSRYLTGIVSLACSDYEFPSFYADLATLLPEEMWSKERQAPQAETGHPTIEVNLVTYKTPDYLLSSAQDYRPGQPGRDEHIWQATMGPDAVVFVNHPACMSEDEAHHPGFWLGNATLPRVAQWKDVLIAVHMLPEDAWMDFTHAYFPTFAFDEYELDGGWAFARKGKGYLAISAMQGIELVRHGPAGYGELRSAGRRNVWICQMGRDAVDGYFKTFKHNILKMKPEWKDLQARFTSLRGERLSFGWERPLLVDGQEQPITGFKHIENPYCTADLPAKQMDIAYGEFVLRLNFD